MNNPQGLGPGRWDKAVDGPTSPANDEIIGAKKHPTDKGYSIPTFMLTIWAHVAVTSMRS